MYDERKMKHDKGFVWTSLDDWLHSLVILTKKRRDSQRNPHTQTELFLFFFVIKEKK